MDNVSVIVSLALLGLFIITCPAEGYVVFNKDWDDQRLQLPRWKRDNVLIMGDNDNRLENPDQGDDGPVMVYTLPDSDDPPEQKEDIFKTVYQPNKNDAAGNRSEEDSGERERRDPNSNEQESNTPLTNGQNTNENEIDYGQNAAAIIITPTSMPSRL